MKIIFDYNRTLFDPETDSLYQGVPGLLRVLSKKYDLFLISKNEPGRREKFEKMSIKKYFQKVVFVENKTTELFEDLSNNSHDVFVVGDRVREEIFLGNVLGFITIWVKQGKFACELPTKEQTPQYIINNIQELQNILSIYEK
jgi:FMN phosphatase YigB (HAD superfamily)